MHCGAFFLWRKRRFSFFYLFKLPYWVKQFTSINRAGRGKWLFLFVGRHRAEQNSSSDCVTGTKGNNRRTTQELWCCSPHTEPLLKHLWMHFYLLVTVWSWICIEVSIYACRWKTVYICVILFNKSTVSLCTHATFAVCSCQTEAANTASLGVLSTNGTHAQRWGEAGVNGRLYCPGHNWFPLGGFHCK